MTKPFFFFFWCVLSHCWLCDDDCGQCTLVMLVFETEEDKRLVLKLEFICEENRTEAQGEHKEEQTACHKPAVGTGVSQPHR